MPLPQAPQRQTTLVPVTPVIGDLLVTVTQEFQRKDLPAYGTPMADVCQQGRDPRFEDHVLTFVAPLQNEREDMYTLYFAAPREDQDEYNWEVTQADIGGSRFDAIARTYVIPRSEYDMASPAMGAAMPNVPEDRFASHATYILAQKNQRRIEREFDAHFVSETRVYVRKVAITQIGTDPLNGGPLASTSTIYHRSEVVSGGLTIAQLFAAPTNAYWGTQSDGTVRTGRQLSAEFYEVLSEQVVSGTAAGGVITVLDYFTTEDFSWPAVFGGVRLYDYELRNGGTEIYAEPYFEKEAYRGPCRAQVQITWSASKFTVSEPIVMQPLPIAVNTPFYNWSVGPCLHESGTLNVVTGNHPKYALNAGTAAQWEATSPTTWPESVLAVDEQKPYRGGWLRTRVTIYQPQYAI